MSANTTYAAFGAEVERLRIEAGIETQAELARRIGATQQTVSRWEGGTSRPRENQLEALCIAISGELEALRRLAGYDSTTPVGLSFDRPFPLETMSPESFERLTADLVKARHPDAAVHRAGGSGHDQDGIDVVAQWPTGRRFTYQCKRVAEFGPAKIDKAVREDTVPADRKYLVLSRVASPQARAALAKHASWELWDRDDISRLLRTLPAEELRRLVRIYFAGQEMQLLGTTVESPWQRPEDFFRPFASPDTLFTHTWQLVGREPLIADVLSRLADGDTRVAVVTGAGGSGKSRILKEILERYRKANPEVTVRVALATPEITAASLADLRANRQLLVVDDAHDRDDLAVLFNYAASNWDRVQLLIVARPYGFDHIKAQAANYSFAKPTTFAGIAVGPLTLEESEALAKQVLEQRGGPLAAAKALAEFTRDCPLATVIGGQVVADNRVHPLLAQGEEVFRSALYSRFEDVIAGQLDTHESPERIRKVMAFVALVQPIVEEDRNLLGAMEAVDGIKVHDALRILSLLGKAGILFKRGSRFRLAPDVLGDFLIEKYFEGPGGRSNGHVEAYFDVLPEAYVENLILNMGRVDWRRAGQAGDGPLLDDIFAKLKPEHSYADPHIKAVTAVAYYQPRRALEFAERLIPYGTFNSQLAYIAKYAAFSDRHLVRALECLWELGKADDRETNRFPSHPIRILTELANPQLNKPLSVNETILEFCQGLSADDGNWHGHYTPFDVLAGLLATEGHTNTYARHTVTFHPFLVPPDWVAGLRARTIDFLVECLTSPNIRKASAAASALGNALHRPMGLFGNQVPKETLSAWNEEFEVTLGKIDKAVRASALDPLVQTQIARSVSWLANYGVPKLKAAAKRVEKVLSGSLESRMDRLLTDAYGLEERRWDQEGHQERWNRHVDTLTAEIRAAHPDNAQLIGVIDARLDRATKANPGTRPTPQILIGKLIDDVDGFAEAVLDAAHARTSEHVGRYAGYALAQLFRKDAAAARRYVKAFMTSGDAELQAAVSIAYGNVRYAADWFTAEDRATLLALLSSDDPRLVQSTTKALRAILDWNAELALDLVRDARIDTARVADEIATLFEFGNNALKAERLSRDDTISLLDKLRPLPELDGHWLEKLLAELSGIHPWLLADFYMRRVEEAVAPGHTHIRPCNHGPWKHEPLRFREAPEGSTILRAVVGWMQENAERKDLFMYYARELFDTMFEPFDAEIVAFLREWLESATARDVELIAGVLHEAPPDFVFHEVDFVGRLLEKAQQAGQKTFQLVEGALFGSAISGVKSGVSGQPFPADIELREKAEKVLKGLSRYSPSRPLFNALREHASTSIARALQDAEDE